MMSFTSVAFADEQAISSIANNNIITNLSESKAVSENISADNTASSSDVPYNVFDIYNAQVSVVAANTTTTTTSTTAKTTSKQTTSVNTTTKKTTAATKTTTSTTTKRVVTAVTAPEINVNVKGIDVSQWQGEIDWKKVKASGVEFAIIRAGYGNDISQKDPMFDTNMKNAQAAGIKCGAYWYSYADSPEDAKKEAEVCYQVIKNYKFQYPVFYDVEENFQVNYSTAKVSAIIDSFCSTLKSKGYYVGLYSYANFLTTKVYQNVLNKYDIWVAHFNVKKPDFAGKYGMWQYSEKGVVSGISEKVDLDYAYLNYPYIINPELYQSNQTTAKTTTKATTTTTKTTAKTTAKTTTKTTTIATNLKIVAKGIDVSETNGTISWSKVKESGIDFAIIRAGYGTSASNIDKNFKTNITGAKAAGVQCGAYWYSNAKNTTEALAEAKACYSVIKEYKYEYPIYYDVQDAAQADLTVSQLSDIVDTFCSYLEKQGYYVGLGGKVSWLNTKYTSSVFEKYGVWVYHGNVSAPSYSRFFGMWKYTNKLTVNGITGNVSGDYSFQDFLSIMKYNHLNGY